MAYRSGYCGIDTTPDSPSHSRCPAFCVNGVRAATRYVMCACSCHDGDEALLERILGETKAWGATPPQTASLVGMLDYLARTNAVVKPPADDEEVEETSSSRRRIR